MSKAFTYVGGPKDKETSMAEEVDFPEVHEGGVYRWSGMSHGQVGAGDPYGALPEADSATAVWHPRDKE